MRHKWKNAHGLKYDPNDEKSECTICGLIRLRLGYFDDSQIYYYPFAHTQLTFKAPKCKAL